MPNRLANETSPYLLQHADNPVDWYAWGPEALDEAKRDDKPILLSIGYAACHWCHVMAHESFEDEETARLMNDNFINIKVDREERPDIDGIYMQAVQAMTGHGGWPMTMFLMPDGSPFYGGTYFPPDDRHGLPSFRKVLESVSDAWQSKRAGVAQSAEQLRDIYDSNLAQSRGGSTLSAEMLEGVYRSLEQRYDARAGGFGGAPKFPATMVLDFLLRFSKRTDNKDALEMVVNSFRKMARGGIYDQIGGGFARYSVDASWLVPHFEKMTYDSALLIRQGVFLWQITTIEEFRRVTEETIDWVEREMMSAGGGFFSSIDADSEGEEGRFYVWDYQQLVSTLDAAEEPVRSHVEFLLQYWGVTPQGNFEGKNILHVTGDLPEVASKYGLSIGQANDTVLKAKKWLYDMRERRVRPARDEKIIASWNGLMLRAVAEAGRVFGSERHSELARRNAEFIWTTLVRGNRVFRSTKDGRSIITGFLEDYAAIALGFLSVFQLTSNRTWLDRAAQIAQWIEELFWDAATGAFYDTAVDAERLITRPREITDNATPSGTSLTAELFLLLNEYVGAPGLRDKAVQVLRSVGEVATRFPSAFGHMLGVLDMELNGVIEVALLGDPATDRFRALKNAVNRTYLPNLVFLAGAPDSDTLRGLPLAEGKYPLENEATGFVCQNFECKLPTTDAERFRSMLEAASRATSSPP